jgi:hypothetical protein
MRQVGFLIAVLMLSPAWGQKALDSGSLYISDPLKWERSQNPDQPDQELAFGRILVVEPEGELATVSCYLYKTPGKQLQIIYPEGFAMASGTWKKSGGQLAVRFRSIHSGARKLDGTDQQYKEELWNYVPSLKGERLAERINVGGVRYIPLQNLSDLKELAEVIRFYRAQK